ncbi:ChbG/HpnK family deacetylase [Pelagicoccus sp. SDUM812002]|uniref:ChbG/HpnK family deacetylase n=1 Tax=Pelagicoccus sp. SDUM812002 TaxID=3041266 RepID=UPI00280CA6B3|nr:ChbG/HpnK family deacetylase [Pelagicoccus sp. SDUM812002]MDQ8188384.1 ChbG/HpnK family deacetylase [Pelagicoccus sp. SDUM812002]
MTSDIQLLVRADDLGSSHAANLACLKSIREGIVRSVEIMPPCSWFPEAVTLTQDLPTGCDVGVHLTLTSEWPNVKWRPLTHCPSLTDSQGFLLPLIWPRFPGDQCLRNTDWKLDEVETEFRAQIELCQANIPQLNHLSYHMGCNDADPQINSLCQYLADEYSLSLDPFAAGFQNVSRNPKSDSSDVTSEIINSLKDLAPGKWILIDHPAFDGPEMRGICEAQGARVASERQGFTDACCSPIVAQLIRERGIELLSYGQIE